MKITLFAVLISLFSLSAGAWSCPKITGTYECKNSDTDFFTITITQKGLWKYEIKSDAYILNKNGINWIVDGKEKGKPGDSYYAECIKDRIRGNALVTQTSRITDDNKYLSVRTNYFFLNSHNKFVFERHSFFRSLPDNTVVVVDGDSIICSPK